MSRPRKPTDQRRHRGTLDHGPIEPREGPIPDCPDGWTEGTTTAWHEFWGSAVASAVDEKADMPAILRLFSLQDERVGLESMVKATPLVKGSTGQLRLNPLAERLAVVDKQIEALEDRFGMSPKARVQTGMHISDTGLVTKPQPATVRRLRAVDPAETG